MKNLLNILSLFTIISTSSFTMIACDYKSEDDNDNNDSNTTKTEKNNLEKAKDFLSEGITINNILPGKTIAEYLQHIKKENEDKIDSGIDFIFDDSYEEKIVDQEADVVVLLEDGENHETVEFKITLPDKKSVMENILKQVKEKIETESIIGTGLLEVDNISDEWKQRILELIRNQINNQDVEIAWSDESTLNSLVAEEQNKGKVELSFKSEPDLNSKIAEFSIIEVSKTRKEMDSNLIANIKLKRKEIDVKKHSIKESTNINDAEFKVKIEKLISEFIDDARIVVTLNGENMELKDKGNEISIKLSTGIDDDKVEEDTTVLLLNVLSIEKEQNEKILNTLRKGLISLDGSSLTADLPLTDERIWNLIKTEIDKIVGNDSSKVKVDPISSLSKSSSVIQQVFNNARSQGRRDKPTPNGGSRNPNPNGSSSGSASTGGTGRPVSNGSSSGSGLTGGTGRPVSNGSSSGSGLTGGTGRPVSNGSSSGSGLTGSTGRPVSTGSSSGSGSDLLNSNSSISDRGKGQSPTSGSKSGTDNKSTSSTNKSFKNPTLGSTKNTVVTLITVGSEKDKVKGIASITFLKVKP